MCGRASITKSEDIIEQHLGALFDPEDLESYRITPNYNVAPTHRLPLVTNQEPSKVNLYRWGLIPFWAKDEKIGYRMINARIETIMEKSAFKNAAKSRRCIVAMDGFYEWKKEGKSKTPYRITMQDDTLFCAAGLWESWTNHKGEEILTFTIITQPANELMQPLHDRMPAILTKDQERLWLDDEVPVVDLIDMITPYDSSLMLAYPVSSRVGNVRENDAALIEPVDNSGPIQGTLF